MDALSDANPGETSQQESIGIQAVGASQLFLESAVILRRQSSGQILWPYRKILALDETGLKLVAVSGQIIEQTTKAEQALLASMIADAEAGKPAKPAKHMRIATKLRKPAYIRISIAKICNEARGNIPVFHNREGLQCQRQD